MVEGGVVTSRRFAAFDRCQAASIERDAEGDEASNDDDCEVADDGRTEKNRAERVIHSRFPPPP
jgi:hypothetical protein